MSNPIGRIGCQLQTFDDGQLLPFWHWGMMRNLWSPRISHWGRAADTHSAQAGEQAFKSFRTDSLHNDKPVLNTVWAWGFYSVSKAVELLSHHSLPFETRLDHIWCFALQYLYRKKSALETLFGTWENRLLARWRRPRSRLKSTEKVFKTHNVFREKTKTDNDG